MKSWTKPTPEEVSAGIARLTKVEIYRYFFDRLNNPKWVLPLKDKGYFSKPPSEKKDSDQGSILFPTWPESEYLSRIADQTSEPNDVLQVAMAIPETSNFRVNEDIIEIAIKLPGALSATLTNKIVTTLRDDRSLSFLSADHLGKLINHLARNGEVAISLKLIPIVFRVKRKASVYSDFEIRDAEGVLHRWDYGDNIMDVAKEVATFDPVATFNVFCDLLSNALIASSQDADIYTKDDSSSIWRPGIDIDQRERSPRDTLISIVRDIAIFAVNEKHVALDSILDILSECGWTAHKRIALYLINLLPDVPDRVVSTALVKKENFQDVSLRNEYADLAKNKFGSLQASDKKQILDWIEEGPDVESFKKGRSGEDTPESETLAYVEHWKLRRLAYIKDFLDESWIQRFNEFSAKHGSPASFKRSRPEIWHGPTSPIEDEKMQGMDFDSLVAFLAEWEPSGEPMSSSTDGLSRVLARVIKKDSQKFALRAVELGHLKPSYLSSFLDGFSTAIDSSIAFPWLPVLQLCQQILQLSYLPENSSDEWGWMRKSIARFLSAGFNSDSQQIPAEHESLVWNILLPLTSDPDPTPEHEQQYGGSNMDPHTLAINTTRGEAFNALIKYVFWKKRNLLAADENHIVDFSSMPEVQEILDQHLLSDPSLAVRSVFGQWFPWLTSFDLKWATDNVETIFGNATCYNDLQQAAWETYLYYIAPYNDMADILHVNYAAAVERIRTNADDSKVELQLGQHIVVYYARGQIKFEDSLFANFFNYASPTLRGQIMDFIGRSLNSEKNDLSDDTVSKFQSLWEWRLSTAQGAEKKESFIEEMAGFGWWFTTDYFDKKWSLTQMHEALLISGKVDMPSDVVEKLLTLVNDEPLLVSGCLLSFIKGDKNGWHTYETKKTIAEILKIAIQSKDLSARKIAAEIINILGSRGNMEFREILSLDPEN